MKKHQISLVGREILPVYYGVKKYQPDVLHLIVTSETEKHRKKLESMLGKEVLVLPHKCNPYNISETKQIIDTLTADPANEYTFNLTGGTKTMAFAAYERVKETGARAFYFTQGNKMVHLDSYDEEAHNIHLTIDEMIQLTGNIIREKTLTKNIDPAEVELARRIMDFLLNYPKIYSSFRKAIDNNYSVSRREGVKKSTLYTVPNHFAFGTQDYLFNRDTSGNGFTISDHSGKVVLTTGDHREPITVLLEGKWWEILVGHAIQQWSPEREIWSSTKFSLKSDSRLDKNEVDVLLNLDTVMLFVECKSGDVKSSDIDKIYAVRETYGGKMSKSTLISFHPVPEKELEKCRELAIEVLAPRNNDEKANLLTRLPKFLDNLTGKLKA